MSDRFGRRPVLLGSLFGFACDFVIMAPAPTLGWLIAACSCLEAARELRSSEPSFQALARSRC